MKRRIALILSALMLLGILAGCGNKADGGETTATQGTGADETTKPEAAGSLIVNAAAAITVSYDADGLVLSMAGLNDDGVELADNYGEVLFGYSCSDVVDQIIRDCVVKDYMFDTNYVVVKLNKGSAQPGTNFLEDIKAVAQGALDTVESAAALVVIGEENLTADGYIDLVTAEVLVRKYLNQEELDNFDGTDEPVDGMYSFEVSYDTVMEQLMVNAQTGAVFQGMIEDLEQIMEDQEDEIEEDTTPVEDLLTEEEQVEHEPVEEDEIEEEDPIIEEDQSSQAAE